MLGEGLRPDASSSLVPEQQHEKSMVPEEPVFFPTERHRCLILNTICKAVGKYGKKNRAPFINAAQFNFLYSDNNGLSAMVTCAWRE